MRRRSALEKLARSGGLSTDMDVTVTALVILIWMPLIVCMFALIKLCDFAQRIEARLRDDAE